MEPPQTTCCTELYIVCSLGSVEWGKGDMLCYVSWGGEWSGGRGTCCAMLVGGVSGVGEGGHVVLC